jgi:hypothetical protein
MMRMVKKMMPLLRISRKLSKAEARIAMDPDMYDRKTFVRNKAILANMERLMAKWISQLGELRSEIVVVRDLINNGESICRSSSSSIVLTF